MSIINERNKNKTLHEKVVDRLIDKAIKHEEPIMLNVNTDRLIEKVADEVEKRRNDN